MQISGSSEESFEVTNTDYRVDDSITSQFNAKSEDDLDCWDWAQSS